MNWETIQTMLKSKSFWAGAGLCGLAGYKLSQQDYEGAWTAIMGALAVWGIRHAVEKVKEGE